MAILLFNQTSSKEMKMDSKSKQKTIVINNNSTESNKHKELKDLETKVKIYLKISNQ